VLAKGLGISPPPPPHPRAPAALRHPAAALFFPYEWTSIYTGAAALHEPDAWHPVGNGLVETPGVNSIAPLDVRGVAPPGGKVRGRP